MDYNELAPPLQTGIMYPVLRELECEVLWIVQMGRDRTGPNHVVWVWDNLNR
jgi:hypothetical protein